MSEEQKRRLEQQLWDIANELRGKMGADEFRDYILGFIFYKYLSETMSNYANRILKDDGLVFESLSPSTKRDKEYLEAIREEALLHLGYYLEPSELFDNLAMRGSGNSGNENDCTFILNDLMRILTHIEASTTGTESEDDFSKLFEVLDLSSTKLGKTEKEKNDQIVKILGHLSKIDFNLDNSNADVLGDAYEYLIAQFASGAGKKAGEFYTPQQVSKVLAQIVTTGKKKLTLGVLVNDFS